jgi:hypothetical protein
MASIRFQAFPACSSYSFFSWWPCEWRLRELEEWSRSNKRAPDVRGARPGPDRVMLEEHNPVTRIDCRLRCAQGQLAEK